MNTLLGLAALCCLLAGGLGDRCTRSCTCTRGPNGVVARCWDVDLAMKFPDGVRHLVIESVPSLNLSLTKHFFQEVGLGDINTIRIVNSTISKIDVDAFEGLDELYNIDLSDSGIILIHPNTFHNNSRLQQLSLSGNPLQLTQVLKGNENYFLKSSTLQELDLSRCQLLDLNLNTLSEVNNLEYINLASNNIKVIDSKFFQNVPFLVDIDLSDNQLLSVDPDTFVDIEDLTTLNLSHNLLSSFDDIDVPDLKELDLSYNDFSHVTRTTFDGVPDLSHLNLAHNGIISISENALSNLMELRHLDLAGNLVQGPLPKILFEGNKEIETLSLAGNKNLRKFDGFRGEFPRLYKLDISDCGLEDLTNSSFLGLSSLAILNISKNSLETLNHASLNNLHRLNDLDVSYNGLSKLGAHTFASNTHLRILNLAGNELHHLPPIMFQTTPHLSQLDLSDNEFYALWHVNESTYMTENNILGELESLNIADNNLKELHKKSFESFINLKHLNIMNNPLVCDEHFPAFIEWLLVHHVNPSEYIGKSAGLQESLERTNLQWDDLLQDVCKMTQGTGINPTANNKKEPVSNTTYYIEIGDVPIPVDQAQDPDVVGAIREQQLELDQTLNTYVWPSLLVVFSIVFLVLAIGNTTALLIYRSRNSYNINGYKTTLASPLKRTIMKSDNTPRYHKLYEECSVPNTPIVKTHLLGNLVSSPIKISVVSKSKPKDEDLV